jgi:hypothetical protein
MINEHGRIGETAHCGSACAEQRTDRLRPTYAAGGTGPDGRPGTQQHAADSGNTPPRSEYGGNEDARSYAGESVVGGPEEPGEPEVVPDMPRSWVPKLAISRELYDMRCPKVRCCCFSQLPQHESSQGRMLCSRLLGCAGIWIMLCWVAIGSSFVPHVIKTLRACGGRIT